MLRKWIVRNFALGTWVKLFGVKYHTLRAARVIWLVAVLVALVIVSDPNYPALQWFDYVALGLLFLAFWLGFDFFGLGYFGLYPVKYQELDKEQKQDYLRGIAIGVVKNPELGYKYGPLTPAQQQEFKQLTAYLEEKYRGSFAGMKNLLPLGISLVIIVAWYTWFYDMIQKW